MVLTGFGNFREQAKKLKHFNLELKKHFLGTEIIINLG